MKKLSEQTLPWYKYTAPWLLMAPVAIVVVASFITLWLAIRSQDGLVAEDYYERGEAISVDLRRDQRAEQLGISALLFVSDDSRTIRLQLLGEVAPKSLTLQFIHPTRDGFDQRIALQHQGTNIYQATLTKPLTQQPWLVIVDDPSQEWRLTEKVVLGSGHNSLLAPIGSKNNPARLD